MAYQNKENGHVLYNGVFKDPDQIHKALDTDVRQLKPHTLMREVHVKLIVLGFNDMSTLVGHFVFSPRKREKEIEEIPEEMIERNKEETGTGMKVKKQNKNIPPLPLPATIRIPRKASSHLLGQKSQEPQSECGY